MLIGTPEEILVVTENLKKKFEIKGPGRTKFCLWPIDRVFDKQNIFVHCLTNIEKIFKRFYMDNTHPLSTPLIVIALDVKRGSFCSQEGNKVFGLEVPYLSSIKVLMYFANNT